MMYQYSTGQYSTVCLHADTSTMHTSAYTPKEPPRASQCLLYTWPRAPLLSSVSFIKRGSARRCTLWADGRRPWAVRGAPMKIPKSVPQVESHPEQNPVRPGKPHPAQPTSTSHIPHTTQTSVDPPSPTPTHSFKLDSPLCSTNPYSPRAAQIPTSPSSPPATNLSPSQSSAKSRSPRTLPFCVTSLLPPLPAPFPFTPAEPAPEPARCTENSACLGDRTSQICTWPEYVAAASVNDEVGWHVREGTGEVVRRVREVREVAIR